MNSILYIKGEGKKSCIGYYDKQCCQVKHLKLNYSAYQVMEKLSNSLQLDFRACQKVVTLNHGFYQKVPVLIELHRLLLFPTLSPKDSTCIWLNYYAIQKISASGSHETRISFVIRESFAAMMIRNGLSDEPEKMSYVEIFPYNIRMIKSQMQRCQIIHEFVFKNRKNMIAAISK